MANRWGNNENSDRLYFEGGPKSLRRRQWQPKVFVWTVHGLCFYIQKHITLLETSCDTNVCRHLRLESIVPNSAYLHHSQSALFWCSFPRNIQIIKYISVNLKISRVHFLRKAFLRNMITMQNKCLIDTTWASR